MGATRSFCGILCIAVIALGLAIPAHAELFNRGTDSAGNRLIYDSGLNITWYDYTYISLANLCWEGCGNWADSLSVDLAGNVYDDWRLPAITVKEAQPPTSYGYDGSTTRGYNSTDSDMGHLFYTELGNLGYYTTEGQARSSGFGLENAGPFQHLVETSQYYTATGWFESWVALSFNFSTGESQNSATDILGGGGAALAVRTGDVVPEPAGAILVLATGMLLTGGRSSKRV